MRKTGQRSLLPYYQNYAILKCPGDPIAASAEGSKYPGHAAPRTYIYNGWGDYFRTILDDDGREDYQRYRHPRGLKQSAVLHPSATIVFGEKLPTSQHVHMDVFQLSANGVEGNDLTELDERRHPGGGFGLSNYAFVDGSVRSLRYGTSLSPLNLWAVTAYWRTNAALN